MAIATAVAGAGTMLLGLVLGLRLLRLAGRTRKAPELAMGLYCLLVTVCALLLTLAFRSLPPESPWAMPLSAGASFALGGAAFALAVGVWRIFRPSAVWARVAVALVGVELLASWIATVAPGEPVTLADPTLANGFFVAGRVAVYFYGAFEALRYASMLRRRVSLGLADPVSAHQIRLWGVAWLAMSGIAIGSMGMTVGLESSLYDRPATALLGNALNVTAWLCTWLAFFPPSFYQRWVGGHTAEVGA